MSHLLWAMATEWNRSQLPYFMRCDESHYVLMCDIVYCKWWGGGGGATKNVCHSAMCGLGLVTLCIASGGGATKNVCHSAMCGLGLVLGWPYKWAKRKGCSSLNPLIICKHMPAAVPSVCLLSWQLLVKTQDRSRLCPHNVILGNRNVLINRILHSTYVFDSYTHAHTHMYMHTHACITRTRTHTHGCAQFLSLLPGRVLRLLEFVGFSGNRELGLEQLTRGAESGTFRANLCSSFLLFYHSVATVLLGVLW